MHISRLAWHGISLIGFVITMKADVELIFLPYAEAQEETIVDVLIRELTSGEWSSFLAAVAFVRVSGNYPELLEALRDFAKVATVELTFGANTFSEGEGSDYEAVGTLLDDLNGNPNVKLYLYSQPDRTFHPKVYVFANAKSALVIIGSSNWTQGGFQRNIEANVLLRLDLADPEQKAAYDKTLEVFNTYWREAQ